MQTEAEEDAELSRSSVCLILSHKHTHSMRCLLLVGRLGGGRVLEKIGRAARIGSGWHCKPNHRRLGSWRRTDHPE